jgi:hypothetical protein
MFGPASITLLWVGTTALEAEYSIMTTCPRCGEWHSVRHGQQTIPGGVQVSKCQEVHQYACPTGIHYVLHITTMEDQLVHEEDQTVTFHLVHTLCNRKQDMIPGVSEMQSPSARSTKHSVFQKLSLFYKGLINTCHSLIVAKLDLFSWQLA